MADDVTFYDDIEAYAASLSCRSGELMPLHVSTHARSYDVVVERWGATRELAWSVEGVAGAYTPPPDDADSAGCGWPISVEIPTDGFRSGFHLVTVTADDARTGRETAHAGFVIRPTTPQNRALIVLATNTWNAYNTWGGKSLYTGGHRVSFRRPWARGFLDRAPVELDDRKARPVRTGETPDADGEQYQEWRYAHGYTGGTGSSGWFSHERRFVEWAEAAGYRLDYAVSSDLHESGALDGYDVVLGVGHDEYWSAPARDAVDAHIATGGDYVSLSGNTMFWQVRLEDDAGEPGIDHMTCHKYRAHLDDPVVDTDPASMSGLWCDPLVGRPEWTTLGAGSVFGLYHRFGQATARGSGAFAVVREDHWMFEGTGLGWGDLLGRDDGVVGYETVGCPVQLDDFHRPFVRPTAGMPDDVTIVGIALSSNLGVGEYPKSIAALSDQGDLEFLAERFHGDTSADNLRRVRNGTAVLLTCRPAGPDGGEVVTAGTTDWVFGLERDVAVQRVTANILDRFLRG
ncbi:MAG: N,N-dimethylformamidase beta subunit family domain-containing protein [Actinomycetota bacterium]